MVEGLAQIIALQNVARIGNEVEGNNQHQQQFVIEFPPGYDCAISLQEVKREQKSTRKNSIR